MVLGVVAVVDDTAGVIAITVENNDFASFKLERLGSEVKNDAADKKHCKTGKLNMTKVPFSIALKGTF